MESVFRAAEALAGEMDKCASGALERNMLALMTAQLLAEGKSQGQLDEICKFLQLLLSLLRSY